MIDSQTVAALVRAFVDDSDGELVKSRDLVLHLLDFTPQPFSRQQFTPGHVTCTGLVRSPDRSAVLLVHHNRLDRWLLPGGHVEQQDPEIWDAARREVVEETGVLLDSAPSQVIGVDVHGIPPGKGEPYHLHHDLLFLFQARSTEFQMSQEARAISWAKPTEFERYAMPKNIRRVYDRADGS